MDGKQKLYFLLDAINDARVLAPSGQPLIIDPINDLNRNYRAIELKQLFTKLEKDEQVIKILQIPSGVKMIDIVEDLDPYDPPYQKDDGCWHIELLSTFDNYYSKIQQEPEYQEFTGKKPVGMPIKPSSGSVMTYEQKLDLVVNAVIEARKATREGQPTTLYLNSTNGLGSLELDEIRGLLLQLQDEKILKLQQKTNRLLPLSQQPANPSYLFLDILEGFDDWFIRYRMKQKSRAENIDWLNLLKALDVCSDIDKQLQLARTNYVNIPSFPYPYIGRYLELFPYDSIGTRKAYQQYRWEGVQYLIKQKAVFEAKYDNEDIFGYGSIGIKVNLINFDDFHTTIKQEFEKRKQTLEEENKPATHTKMSEKESVDALWSDDFRWEGNDYIFGKYGSIPLQSKDRKYLFKALTDKKGGWATISELKGNKNAGYVRSTIKQIEDRFTEEIKKHISIVSTQEDDSIEKPNTGAYRIKFQP